MSQQGSLKLRQFGVNDEQLKLIAAGTVIAASGRQLVIDFGTDIASIRSPIVSLFITAIKSSIGDESYQIDLEQSPTGAWAGEETLLGQIIYASAVANDLDVVLIDETVFGTHMVNERYVSLNVTVGGTAPSFTLGAYLSGRE